MFYSLRRRFVPLILAFVAVVILFEIFHVLSPQDTHSSIAWPTQPKLEFKWKDVPQRYPVESYVALPTEPVKEALQIQTIFGPESTEERNEREARLAAVKEAFIHSWEGYKSHAWLKDEVSPLSGLANNGFGGWGATLIDSLDTLWIMGLTEEFAAAVSDLSKIDFTTSSLHMLNVFETNIRYLGGLLGAYDISAHKYEIILEKAIELGDMLFLAFDTPTRMPITRWDWKNAALGGEQEAEGHALLAEVGSMTLEFTRLSQLTGDHKYYDAVARVVDVLHDKQNQTKLPGLWPQMLDMRRLDFSQDTYFNIGSMSDSAYEYLPKQYLLLGGESPRYRNMYSMALKSATENLFFEPLDPNNGKMLLAGTRKRNNAFIDELIPEGQHLSCFAGGMVALGAKAFKQLSELEIARRLVAGCVWAYESMPSGIMPEIFTAIPCVEDMYDNCTWSQQGWYDAVDAHVKKRNPPWERGGDSAQQIILQNNLPQGMVEIRDPRYNLRPEAIESIFVLYRITGDKALQDKAWSMFQAINNITRTEIAHASVTDVTQTRPELSDSMESFWTAETLKYFYLIFSEPDIVSLDDYVLNTEAHPLLRPK